MIESEKNEIALTAQKRLKSCDRDSELKKAKEKEIKRERKIVSQEQAKEFQYVEKNDKRKSMNRRLNRLTCGA